jgi:hypothetical protein
VSLRVKDMLDLLKDMEWLVCHILMDINLEDLVDQKEIENQEDDLKDILMLGIWELILLL